MRTRNDKLPFVAPEESIERAMTVIGESGAGIALVVDAEKRLVATVTDGDVRRAILSGLELSLPLTALLEQPGVRPHAAPTAAPVGTSEARLVELMTSRNLRQIPLVDEGGRVADLVLMSDLVRDYELPLEAVIMAGGFGRRLGTLTEQTPKPMLRVGDAPLLERIVAQLREAGIRRVNITTHYLGDQIARHFGNGDAHGVEISYVSEDEPLGTAGALGLMEAGTPLLVMNGDIVTNVDFRALLDFHRDNAAEMTVAVRPYEVRVPFGVVDVHEGEVRGICEKPLLRGFVNAGIYLLAPAVLDLVPAGERCDMPDLIEMLTAQGRRVVGFPLREYWLDIGELADYERALGDFGGAR